MGRTQVIGWVGTGLLVVLAAAACSINPQPVPPDEPEGSGFGGRDGGISDTPGTGSATVAGSDGADAGSLGKGEDAAAPVTDGGTAAPDASADAGDGGETDAGDAGEASDAADGSEPDAG